MFWKNKNFWAIFFILVLFISAANLDYPKYWNKGAEYLNSRLRQGFGGQAKFNIPHFWNRPFRLGLDLQGGTQLVYETNLENIEQKNKNEAVQGVRDVIERRVNAFGVAEPLIQVTRVGEKYRLIVELAGVKDTGQAIKMIGETPTLDFREEDPNCPKDTPEWLCYKPTSLTGKYLRRAQVNFSQVGEPVVNLEFDSEGAKIFEELTGKNVGKILGIYLDGLPLSLPRVSESITGGKAQITGRFTAQEAKDLVRRLNAGALPVPIKLLSQQTISASLGEEALKKSLKASLYGFAAITLFMLLIYWFRGLTAILALVVYAAVVLAIFKLIPVTLTLAGIAGFVMSIGMAVDANILIFERMKEERKAGKSWPTVIEEGFTRAWPSIRDSNFSTLLTCFILYWFGASIISGFALTLAIGILVSMFSALFVTKFFLKLIYK